MRMGKAFLFTNGSCCLPVKLAYTGVGRAHDSPPLPSLERERVLFRSLHARSGISGMRDVGTSVRALLLAGLLSALNLGVAH